MDSDSSDDFDQLKVNLPEYQRRIRRQSDEIHFEDIGDFEYWRLNRFNRSSSIHFFELFSNSYALLKRRPLRTIMLIPVLNIPLAFLYFIHSSILFSIYFVIIYMITISTMFSIINGEKIVNSFKYILSLQGALTIISKLVSSYLLLDNLSPADIRKPSTLVKLVIFNFIVFFSLYQGCFIFEGKNISALNSLKFSIQIVLTPSQFVHVLLVYFIYLILQLLSIFTLGFSGWFAVAIVAYSFLALCGSSASASSMYSSTTV